MSDDEKLKAPSFERMVAGVAVGGATIAGAPVAKTIRYETKIVRERGEPPDSAKLFTPPADRVASLAQSGAAAGAATRTTGRARYRNPRVGIAVETTEYVVATKSGLRQAAAADGTYAGAAEALRAYAAAHPLEAGDLQIVRKTELV
jgi:hypothetical protein